MSIVFSKIFRIFIDALNFKWYIQITEVIEVSKDIGSTLKMSRMKAGLSVKQISSILTGKGYKASEKTIYSWENGNSQPSPDALLEMCDAYGIKDILSTFGYDGYNEDGSLQLNIKEQGLIEKFRNLDDTGKEHLFVLLDWELKRLGQLENASRRVPIPNYSHPELAAAHMRNDVEHSEEEIQSDLDMMSDENF